MIPADERLPSVHPGEVLEEDFLKPAGISHYRLARDLGVPQRRIDEIVAGKRGITAETALLFSRYFGTSAQVWMGLQTQFDLETARRRMEERLEQIRPRDERPLEV